MDRKNIKDFLEFSRAIHVVEKQDNLTEQQAVIIEQVKQFGIDEVYFLSDEENSYPALFLKQVTNFDTETLKDITEIQRKAWNYKKVLFLYVYSDTEIRIYNCLEKPVIITTENLDYTNELKAREIVTYTYSDKQQLTELHMLFSRIAIDSGIIWTLEEAQKLRDKIRIERRVDKYLVDSLSNTAAELANTGLKLELIHRIILRSLFLLYLEDRGATGTAFYLNIKSSAKSYFDILDDKNATYKLFEQLNDYFNGNIFTLDSDENASIKPEHLQIIKRCFIYGNDGTPQKILFQDWRLFNFSIIQIELLSEIYENFLFRTDPKLKKVSGAYYTPPSLVEFILNEKLPIGRGYNNYNIKILDPSCGSGIFLVESFKRLVKRYENKHNKKLSDFNVLKELLVNNIFGIEIHPQAIKVAAFSLYLALVDYLDPKTLWQKEQHRLPYLINDPNDLTLKRQGNNLFRKDAIKENIAPSDFDLIIGNPPFGTKNLPEAIKKYCAQYDFAKEMVLPFLHKATTLALQGEIALIFNTKILTNTGSKYQNFRKWLFNDCYVEKVYNFSILRKTPKDFGGQLFSDAVGPISIIFYQKAKPKIESDRIAYYAPKTYIKSNIIEGLIIDDTDLKYLPREECQKPDTKIWKIAMWGEINDWELIQQLEKRFISIQSFFKKEHIQYGVGFESSNPKTKFNNEIKDLPIHTPYNILKYYTPIPPERITIENFRRLGKLAAYKTHHVVLNEGIKVIDNELSLLASFIDYNSAYVKGIVGIYAKNKHDVLLKLLTIYFNSNFIRYYAFLTTSSWGVERDVVKHRELFNAPYLFEKLDNQKINYILKLFDGPLYSKETYIADKHIEDKINKIIFDFFSEKEQSMINHLLNNIDLFHKHEKSKMLYPVLDDQPKEYAKIITSKINTFLSKQNIFVNATIYNISSITPLIMIKLSHENVKKDIHISKENITTELEKIDNYLWEKKGANIYFKKKLNYVQGNDIYIIRPNQRRFWSAAMAFEDASEILLELLNGSI
ncbi:HsdM family class I SAM-dependent methyltransferase [Treponema denticola]|uniref:HsdM family class I SAM-dependent methyltransferase n=1 Tax=Treponema denticola TaxID=158 RepID=UPI0002B5F16C|nr:N-6 DNA methylase [Treponema denticola]EMB22633.1 hypothetical protein HMPREF9724_01577 [Treponema denticola SP37]EPF34660.1 hypothetical protein HMPREF9734_00200 [Treponema denticola SP44]EPF38448.1 hypothetical protein HMPREF9731_02457 [Treponema denticola SP23]